MPLPSSRLTLRRVLLLCLVLAFVMLPASATAAAGRPPEDRGGPQAGPPSAAADRGNPRADDRQQGGPRAEDPGQGGPRADDRGKGGLEQAPAPADERPTTTAPAPSSTSPSSPAPASRGGGSDRCIRYSFRFTDGHTQSGEWCGQGMNVTGGHVPSLHVSCSDTFDVAVPGGTTSNGVSDLGGHVIVPRGWWIVKDNGSPCGSPNEPPPPTCTGPLTVVVRDAVTDALVGGGTAAVTTTTTTSLSLDGDGTTAGGSFPCGTAVAATLTTRPAGYGVTVSGSDAGTVTSAGLTLVFTVTNAGSPPPPPPPPPPGTCDGPLVVEVRRAGSLTLVREPGAAATIAGLDRDLDDDGRTDAGRFTCGTDVTGTLETPPDGYVTVDGHDTTTVTASGGTLVFLVRVPTEVEGVVEVCRGDLVVRVVTTAGELIDGAEVVVAGERMDVPDGEVRLADRACGPVTGHLDEPPTGWTPVPPEHATVTIVDGQTAEMEFVVDQASVLGVVIERPAPAPAADEPESPAPSVLARTGTGAGGMLGLGLLGLMLGVALLALARDRRRPSSLAG